MVWFLAFLVVGGIFAAGPLAWAWALGASAPIAIAIIVTAYALAALATLASYGRNN